MTGRDKQLLLDVIRHGQPEGGDILRGRIDPPLTDLGWQQMRTATGLMPSGPHTHAPAWTHIVCSPLQRCRAFAEAAADELKLRSRLSINDQWVEIDYGDWDGMPIEQWRNEAKDQFSAFKTDLSALAPPNGERYIDFRDRIVRAWSDLRDYPADSHVLLVTHGGVLRVILPLVLGMPFNASAPLHIPFASFSRLQISFRKDKAVATLLFHNAAEHPMPAG
jgi:broad specificity phosphatase PhoE